MKKVKFLYDKVMEKIMWVPMLHRLRISLCSV